MTTVSSLPSSHELFPRLESGSSLAAHKRRNILDHSKSYQQLHKHGRLSKTHVNRASRQRKRPSSLPRGPDNEDSRHLAADPNVVLPSDRSPSKPQLKRQEAFREPNAWHHSDVVENDSDLYKLGLLYDDEHVRGSYFSLDTIVHSEPVYSVRPAKRARKSHRDTSHLHLDLSFASLGSDLEIQHYLAPDVALLTPPADDDIPETQDAYRDDINPEQSYRDAALSVIHELPESSPVSFDAHALEAPDFHNVVSNPAIKEKGRAEEDDDQDWALLDADVLSTTDTDADTEVTAEDATDAASIAGEAWIVLGDGS
ncbi:hypothetical protein F5Y05DRAFT_23402 [Hypoxylon sp. FL0543]|nr:hypothetical protein F5Y05DRAFT_23402 [Hypoxylon sp. FL0543]